MGLEQKTFDATESPKTLIKFFEDTVPLTAQGVSYREYIRQIREWTKVPRFLKDPDEFARFHGFMRTACGREVNGKPLEYNPEDFIPHGQYARSGITGDPARLQQSEQKRRSRAARRRLAQDKF